MCDKIGKMSDRIAFDLADRSQDNFKNVRQKRGEKMQKSPKINRRTFRYSDEVAAILSEYDNNLEELVLDAYYRLPELREQYVMQKELLQDLQSEALNVRRDIEEIKLIGLALSSTMDKLLLVNRRLDDLAAGRLRRG